MNINKLTEKSQDALRLAHDLAARRNHQSIDIEHLLAALLEQTDGLATPLLRNAGVNIDPLKERLAKEIDRIPSITSSAPAPPYATLPED